MSIRPGEIEIKKLGITLTPSISVIRATKKFGGPSGIIEMARTLDPDDMATIIEAVALVDPKDLPERIYKAGLVDVSSAIQALIVNTCNGGRPPSDTASEGADPSPD